MKKRSLVVITALLFGVCMLQAQDKKEGHKVGGIRAGWQASGLFEEGSKPDTAQSLSSFYVGFYRDTKIIPLLHFGAGLEYFQSGMQYSKNTSRVLHTMSIPLNLKLKLGPIFALTGFAANIKVSERFVYKSESTKPLESDKSNSFDIPFFLGAGVKIWRVSVEARYHWGLLEVRNGKHSQYFQLGGAIAF